MKLILKMLEGEVIYGPYKLPEVISIPNINQYLIRRGLQELFNNLERLQNSNMPNLNYISSRNHLDNKDQEDFRRTHSQSFLKLAEELYKNNPTKENKELLQLYIDYDNSNYNKGSYLGETCLGTATGNKVLYNRALYDNPSKYGYTRIYTSKYPLSLEWQNNLKPGDLILLGGSDPYHAMVYEYSSPNSITFQQSHGGLLPCSKEEKSYPKKDSRINSSTNVYRYSGTPKLLRQWKLDYKKLLLKYNIK